MEERGIDEDTVDEEAQDDVDGDDVEIERVMRDDHFEQDSESGGGSHKPNFGMLTRE